MEGGRLSCQTFDELDVSERIDLLEGRMLKPYMIGSTSVIIDRTSKSPHSTVPILALITSRFGNCIQKASIRDLFQADISDHGDCRLVWVHDHSISVDARAPKKD